MGASEHLRIGDVVSGGQLHLSPQLTHSMQWGNEHNPSKSISMCMCMCMSICMHCTRCYCTEVISQVADPSGCEQQAQRAQLEQQRTAANSSENGEYHCKAAQQGSKAVSGHRKAARDG